MRLFKVTSFHSRTSKPGLARVVAVMLTTYYLIAGPGIASPPTAAANLPHVNARAQQNYSAYQYADGHKAFAIAPGGAWAWQADAVSPEDAKQQALENCQANTQQKCVLYALDERVVFNNSTWPTLWGPYAGKQDTLDAATGTGVGQRFYDLTYKDAAGKSLSLSGLRGKITFVHFWGSWCPPCMREFPSLKILQQRLEEKFSADVVMVFLQVREPYSKSRQWAEQNGFGNLPLYDSLATDSDHTSLSLASDNQIEDRKIARVFPSSYVLDRNGLVVFSHYGPVENWLEYLPFFEDAVARSEFHCAAAATASGKGSRTPAC